MVNSLKTEEFKEKVLEAKGKVLVDFYADWCGPCKMQAPINEELSNEMKNVAFFKLNVDEESDIASEYGIMSIPTMIIFENGKAIKTFVGLTAKETLKEALK